MTMAEICPNMPKPIKIHPGGGLAGHTHSLRGEAATWGRGGACDGRGSVWSGSSTRCASFSGTSPKRQVGRVTVAKSPQKRTYLDRTRIMTTTRTF